MPKNKNNRNNFDEVVLKLASPERVLEWSRGEVTKPETINYRTQRPEKNGLFDEKIFGPEKDFECYCGKYKGIRFKGIVCEKCGVEITRSVVRRERMGHIDLAVPVSHIWFLRGIPSRIALLLGLSTADVEKVIYFAGYIITSVHEAEKERLLKELDTEYKKKLEALKSADDKKELKTKANDAKKEIASIVVNKVLDEASYHRYAVKYGAAFEAEIGAEAVYKIFQNLDLGKFEQIMHEKLEKANATERVKLRKRITLAINMKHGKVRPEWMFVTQLPVIPPALRPMVALEGGRHASSDLNDLYRRVINRNSRLKKLMAIHAPDVILRNEKRILQEAVDSLLDNTIRRGSGPAMGSGQKRPLKSLADHMKGKQGYFRQNLLGKRVDYSGRSVIVIGPDLELDQCGLPKAMALELFRPFVIAGLLESETAFNIRGANKLIDDGIPEVWALLEETIKDKHVLLNRAPTLHRQSLQAFRPVLIEGKAIQIHALVCPAFNADFDGDQMAVHVPLSLEAQTEAKEIMSANKNILKPGSGEVTTGPTMDIVLGVYWMTNIMEKAKGEGKVFETTNAAITAYDFGAVDLRAKILVLPSENDKYAQFNGELFETSVGRLLFNSVLPNDFRYINSVITKRDMKPLIDELIEIYGLEGIPQILDRITHFGFKYATQSGVTWGMSDVKVPEKKHAIIAGGKKAVAELRDQYNEGLLSEGERRRMTIETWQNIKSDVEKVVDEANSDEDSSVTNLIRSGARGSVAQLTNMGGMKGLIQNPKGDIIEFPITTSFKEGLSPIEYFITTHGSRKGLADTALKTASAGYLTRRLFDVSQDVIIVEEDCGTSESLSVSKINSLGIEVSIAKNIKGRVLAEAIEAGEKKFKKGHLLSGFDAQDIEDAGKDAVKVFSPMMCNTKRGVCAKCYGSDLTTSQGVELGEAVGTIAAQSLGEPSTQLTMNTKHATGASIGGDITQGLPRVEEVIDRRNPKSPAVIAKINGTISEIVEDENGQRVIMLMPEIEGSKILKRETQYKVPPARMLLIKAGSVVKKGDLLTDGSANIADYYAYAGEEKAREYIITEILKIYDLQGIAVSRKHLEIIVKQMFSRRKIVDPGDTRFTVGQTVELSVLAKENEETEETGGVPAHADKLVLGITEVALTRDSWLSSASFQHTTRKLTEDAVRGAVDKLVGLKENVILGRLIPAGTGFKNSKKSELISALPPVEQKEYRTR